jgi:site-specific recombinase XerD
MYGSGLRIMEALRLRVKDVDFKMKQVTVRSGKGDKDRFTTLSASLIPLLEGQVQKARVGNWGHISTLDNLLIFRHSTFYILRNQRDIVSSEVAPIVEY